jgi:lipopolysaccharide biosynthesis protein
MPGELGYYDLRETLIQKRQIELAKLYGIGGFCYYFYWFGGKRLLETPIKNYLNDSSLDLPFCLCWANENWSRRWDGLDSEILIAQQHSPEDDVAFIEYLSQYLSDSRYIRIDGRPLLLVYRPGLLPSPKQTAKRWRDWCQKNGIGEIYLAYTQSFEAVDPQKYGFDAAVEFPPNNMSPPLITQDILDPKSEFTGQIYDWSVFPERSKQYKKPSYKLFRGVNPSWDNTARRKSNGTILYGSSPMKYQQWLYNAIKDSFNHNPKSDERLVFVNAWNEWAEGAYLEPDLRYGYAYLEATRMAMQKAQASLNIPRVSNNQKLAIVIHAFYLDVFEEILNYVTAISMSSKLYVTTIYTQESQVKKLLTDSGVDFHLLAVENRGRDILPFLKIIPLVIANEHEFVLKVHTKKSKHRVDGDVWRYDLYEKLMAPDKVTKIIETLANNDDVGMVGPEGHIVPMTEYWGYNEKSVLILARRMGIDQNQVMSIPFVAGTMFYIRVSALLPLLCLSIDETDFEEEAGQVDGTLAHAMERLFSIAVYGIEKRLVSTDSLACNEASMITQNYPFVS